MTTPRKASRPFSTWRNKECRGMEWFDCLAVSRLFVKGIPAFTASYVDYLCRRWVKEIDFYGIVNH